MAENKKTRWYTVQRNYDFETHDADKNVTRDITEDEWREEIKAFMHELYESDKIKQYAMIFHDKDKLETGFKPIHVHMIVELSAPARKSAAMALLGGSSDKNVDYADEKGARAGASRYLLHITEKAMQADKHIYGEDELIIEGGLDIHKMMKGTRKQQSTITYSEVEKLALQLSLEIEENGMTVKQARQKLYELIPEKLIAHKVWLDWQFKFERSDETYKTERENVLSEYGRTLTNMFVNGKGGVGKSTFAQKLALALANEAPFKATVGGKDKTFDFADKYGRQKVTILDDAKGGQFDMEEYLQVFDPYIYSPVSSRNTNKAWLSEYAILTTSETIDEFNESIMIYSAGGSKFKNTSKSSFGIGEETEAMQGHEALNNKEKTLDRFYQVARRMKYVFEIKDSTITMKRFNDKTVSYDTVATYAWDVKGDSDILDETVAKILAHI